MKRAVLLADVAPHARRLATGFLQLAGYEVVTAFDGNSALETTIHHEPRVSILITEATLPGMDGFRLTRAVKQVDGGIPVLILSLLDSRRAALEAGADAFLAKPIEYNSFIAAFSP